MASLTPPKKFKDPVMIAGSWKERNPPCPRAGTTMVDVNDPNEDPEDVRSKAGIPFKPADKKKK